MRRITHAYPPKPKRKAADAEPAPRPTAIVTAKPPKQIDAYKRLLKLREETRR